MVDRNLLLEHIIDVETKIKKKYPKQKGKVLITSAKQAADYSVDDKKSQDWCVAYFKELSNRL